MTGRHTALRHDALVYAGEEEFTKTVAPFVDEGLQRAEAVLAVTTSQNIALLRECLGPRSVRVEFIDAGEWYQAPVRTIANYQSKIDEALGSGAPAVRVIGEVAFGAQDSTHHQWVRYESALNRVFSDAPAWIVCPYDARRLPATVVEEAARTHPHLMARDGRRRSEAYVRPERFAPQGVTARREPPPTAGHATLTSLVDVRAARDWLRSRATDAGLTPQRVDELLVAVGEVMANALIHGRPPVHLWLWHADGDLHVRVSDTGAGIQDELAGFQPPPAGDMPQQGMGLWLARNLCRTVDVLRERAGAHVHLTMPI